MTETAEDRGRAAQVQLEGLSLSISEKLRDLRYDPVTFLRWIIPWGRGAFSAYKDLWPWQVEHLAEIGRDLEKRAYFPGGPKTLPSRWAVPSGNGTGKGKICIPGIALWYLLTRPRSQGFITAPTERNLRERAWADLRTMLDAVPWLGGLVRMNEDRIAVVGYESSWKIVAAVTSPGNTDSIRGVHSTTGWSLGLYDEASGVGDGAQEAAESSIAVDGSCLQVAYSQPKNPRGVGWFSRAAYGELTGEEDTDWRSRRVPRWFIPGTTEEEVEAWAKWAGGRHTDRWRVYVSAEPPEGSEQTFITETEVELAMSRSMRDERGNWLGKPDAHVVMGVDPAGRGDNEHVIWFRAGLDATLPHFRMRGRDCPAGKFRDTLAWCLEQPPRGTRYTQPPVFCWIDATRSDGHLWQSLVDRGLTENCRQVVFSSPPHPSLAGTYANRKAEGYGLLKEALSAGMVLPRVPGLKKQLTGQGCHAHPRTGAMVMEDKAKIAERGGPDDLGLADALMLTCFGVPHGVKKRLEFQEGRVRRGGLGSYEPGVWV